MSQEPADRPGVVTPPPVVFAIFAGVGLAIDYLLLPTPPLPFWIRYGVGTPLILAGAGLIFLSIREFRRAKTSFNVYTPDTALLTSGPFRRSRNPIYVGFALTHIGIALAASKPWMLAAVVPALVVIRYGVVAREEHYLERKFGDAYRRYRDSVRRWL